jgi:hypothetical protein
MYEQGRYRDLSQFRTKVGFRVHFVKVEHNLQRTSVHNHAHPPVHNFLRYVVHRRTKEGRRRSSYGMRTLLAQHFVSAWWEYQIADLSARGGRALCPSCPTRVTSRRSSCSSTVCRSSAILPHGAKLCVNCSCGLFRLLCDSLKGISFKANYFPVVQKSRRQLLIKLDCTTVPFHYREHYTEAAVFLSHCRNACEQRPAYTFAPKMWTHEKVLQKYAAPLK